MAYFTGAVSRFRLFSPSGYNIPKPKFMYFVNFISRNLTTYTQRNLSFFVKTVDRLQLSYDVAEINQYNKKRLIQGKLSYGPLNLTLHDTVDGTAAKLIEAYNRFHYGDFHSKNNNSWAYDITGANFESTPNWGYMGTQTPNNNYFLDRIEVYEIHDQIYSQVNFINPKFTSVSMSSMSSEEGGGSEVSITAKYEGAVFQAICQPITQQLATMFGLPYHNDIFQSLLGGLNIPGFDIGSGVGLNGQSIFSSIGNILNNTLNGGRPGGIFNTVNSVLNGVIPAVLSDSTIFQTINGVFGSGIGGALPQLSTINPLNDVASVLSDVQRNVDFGLPVRSVTTGSFDVVGNLFRGLGF